SQPVNPAGSDREPVIGVLMIMAGGDLLLLSHERMSVDVPRGCLSSHECSTSSVAATVRANRFVAARSS
ncbi:MAG: hypothetical protein ACTHQQ_05655, partial [Solirubrobacteraceae bacterium]